MLKQTHRANVTLPEIFEYVNKQESNNDKLEALQSYANTKQLQWFVNAMYNFDFTDYNLPKYKVNNDPVGITQTISKNLNRIESAIKLHQKGNIKRFEDNMNIVLEVISKDEAKLLENLFTNKKVEGISKTIWKRLYPEFFRSKMQSQTD